MGIYLSFEPSCGEWMQITRRSASEKCQRQQEGAMTTGNTIDIAALTAENADLKAKLERVRHAQPRTGDIRAARGRPSLFASPDPPKPAN